MNGASTFTASCVRESSTSTRFLCK
jgi:hypothetical protein